MLYLVCYWNFFTGRIFMKRRINILCLIALLLSFVLPYTPAAAKAPAMKRRLTLTVGQKTTLKISGGIIRKKSFKSSKKSIVSVTSKGKLTAKKAGQCKITATIQWKPKKSFRKFFKKKLYCQVTVQNKKRKRSYLSLKPPPHGTLFETWCRVSLFIRCRVSARSKPGNKRPKCSP